MTTKIINLTNLNVAEAVCSYRSRGYNGKPISLYLLDEPILGFNAIYHIRTNAGDFYDHHYYLVNYDEKATTFDGVHQGAFDACTELLFCQIEERFDVGENELNNPVIEFDADGNIIEQVFWS